MKFYIKAPVLIVNLAATATSADNDSTPLEDLDVFGGASEAPMNAAATQTLLEDLSSESEPNATQTYLDEYLDPNYWHPKSKNFEIINWTKFEEKCGDTVPFTFDPVQRNGPMLQDEDIFDSAIAGWGRLDELPDEVIATGPLPNVGTVSDPDMGLFYGLLGQAHNSSLIPEPLKNKLFWTYCNFVPEYLLGFNRVAWRENTPDGRVIGLHKVGLDWTMSANKGGFAFSNHDAFKHFVNYQMSPSGKFLKLYYVPLDPSDPTVEGYWIDMYIVQKGDVFSDKNGNVIDYVEPGDVIRLTTNTKHDAYACYDDLYWTYIFRTVATWDEETMTISPGPAYDALIEAVTVQPASEERDSSKNFTDSTGWTTDEKFDFLVTYEPDRMMYRTAPMPPSPEFLNNIGSETENGKIIVKTEEVTDNIDENEENQHVVDEQVEWSSSNMHVVSRFAPVLNSVVFIILFRYL